MMKIKDFTLASKNGGGSRAPPPCPTQLPPMIMHQYHTLMMSALMCSTNALLLGIHHYLEGAPTGLALRRKTPIINLDKNLGNRKPCFGQNGQKLFPFLAQTSLLYCTRNKQLSSELYGRLIQEELIRTDSTEYTEEDLVVFSLYE